MARKTFKVGPKIIEHMISSQAGSLEKALLECYMNSVDAGASAVTINIAPRGDFLEVLDDGCGWHSEAEIEETFGCFGFDHGKDNPRTYGKFGLGRGQLWNWCSAVYRTNGFRLSCDVRKDGLDYEVEADEHVDGCRIVARFYETYDPRSQYITIRNLKEWLRYAEIPVTLNGELISTDPAKEKWDLVSDDVYISAAERSSLIVYNQGVFVTRLGAHEFGIGGTVISRKPLKLNVARNEVMRNECKVWPAVRESLRKLSGRKTRSNKRRLTDSNRAFIIGEWLAGEQSFAEIADLSLMVDARGRARKLEMGRAYSRVAISDQRGSVSADRAIASQSAMVLAPEVKEWFDVKNAAELRTKIMGRLQDELSDLEPLRQYSGNRWKVRAVFNSWNNVAPVEWSEVEAESRSEHHILDQKDLGKKEAAQFEAAKALAKRVYKVYQNARREDRASRVRKLLPGQSDTAQAWTDGKTYIALDCDIMKRAFSGVDNLTRLPALLLHECIHDSSSADDTHTHSGAFYEDFHEIILSPRWTPRGLTDYAMREYEKALHRRNLSIPKWVATEGRVLEDSDTEGTACSTIERPESNPTERAHLAAVDLQQAMSF